jgi:Cdc6-like AAA superfamily ATPase
MVDANQSTARDILIQITDQYAYDYPKKPLRKVINTLKTYIDQSYKHNVIIIDNLQLIKSYKGDAVANLYRHLIDVQRNLRTSTVSFVFISNKRVKFLEGEERPEQAFSKGEMLLAGEDEGRPLLTPIQIIFGPYKAQELRDICKQRIQMGWVDLGGEEISNDLVDKMITGYENSGDARRCLLQVKDWLYDAHQEGLRKITHEFLDNVELEKRTQRTEESYVKETCSGLLKEQKMIIIALAQVMMNQNEEWIAYVDLKARTDTLLQERGMKISRTQFLRHTTYLKELELVDHSLEDNKSRYRLQIEPRPALEALKNVL